MCKMCFQEISPCFKQNRNDELPRLYVQEHLCRFPDIFTFSNLSYRPPVEYVCILSAVIMPYVWQHVNHLLNKYYCLDDHCLTRFDYIVNI